MFFMLLLLLLLLLYSCIAPTCSYYTCCCCCCFDCIQCVINCRASALPERIAALRCFQAYLDENQSDQYAIIVVVIVVVKEEI
jgi:hypothetical protein